MPVPPTTFTVQQQQQQQQQQKYKQQTYVRRISNHYRIRGTGISLIARHSTGDVWLSYVKRRVLKRRLEVSLSTVRKKESN